MKLNELLIQAAKKYGYSYTLNEKGLFVTHGQGHGRNFRKPLNQVSQEVKND